MRKSKYLMTSAAALAFLGVQVVVVQAEPMECGNYYQYTPEPEGDQLSDPENIGWNRTRIANEELCRNLAISNALDDADLVADEKFGIRLNFGTANNENVGAFGLGATAVITDNLNGTGARLTGSGAIAFSGDQRGSRVGLQLSW